MPATPGPQPPTPGPRPRGGPRPGAGAPRGNINALLSGQRSARYADATLYVRVLLTLFPDEPVLRRFTSGPLSQRRVLLDAANWAIRNVGHLTDQVEENIRISLPEPPDPPIPQQDALSDLLAQRPHPARCFQRAFSALAYVAKHDQDIARFAAEWPLRWFLAAPVLATSRQPPATKKRKTPSDNQTIKASGAG